MKLLWTPDPDRVERNEILDAFANEDSISNMAELEPVIGVCHKG